MKIFCGIFGIIILLIMGVVFIYVPGTNKRLEKRAKEFMREFKPQAEKIDATFHHQDRTVNREESTSLTNLVLYPPTQKTTGFARG